MRDPDLQSDSDRPSEDQPLGERRFSTGVTLFCLVAWLLLVAANKLAQEALDPLAQFDEPVQVLVRATEGPLELALGFERLAGQELSGPLSLEGLRGELADQYVLGRERLEGAVAEDRIELDERVLIELRVRAAVLRAGEGEAQALLAAEQLSAWIERWPLVEAFAVAFAEHSTERPDALLEAAEGMLRGPARTELLERLGQRLDRPAAVADRVETARADAEARVERGLRLAALFVPLGLIGVGMLGALLALPPRSVRLDPPARPHPWPAFADGLGLFARYGVGFFAVQTVLALTVGQRALGWSAAVSSAPLLLFALARYGSTSAASVPLGGGLAHDRIGRLVAFPLGGWIAAYAGLLGVAILLSNGASDPFANPFLELLSDADEGLRTRLLIEACLWAPIFEELAFRGALFGGLRARFGFLPSALISSIAFGSAHAYDAVGIAGIIWVGFALAWLYERTRSIWACMLAHALFNFGQLQVAFLVFG